jgi:hypothetical protein
MKRSVFKGYEIKGKFIEGSDERELQKTLRAEYGKVKLKPRYDRVDMRRK